MNNNIYGGKQEENIIDDSDDRESVHSSRDFYEGEKKE